MDREAAVLPTKPNAFSVQGDSTDLERYVLGQSLPPFPPKGLPGRRVSGFPAGWNWDWRPAQLQSARFDYYFPYAVVYDIYSHPVTS